MLEKIKNLLSEHFNVRVYTVGTKNNVLKLTVQDINSKGVDILSEIKDTVEDIFLKRSGTGITITIKVEENEKA